ncbi:MAG: hypothetical protein CVV44_18560 [Spirochaetae bacterium HGW-Spirochaetae-1]|jgi:hypothetical protein|nr:MAG: hypothetical protein CVV44_18560 [Spirochaetae bacterium HGW-Spirochaetae-1]
MKRLVPIFLAAITIIYASCGSKNYFQVIKVPEEKFYQGQYKEAARMLLPEVNRSGKDQLLYMMECGYMLHAGAEYETSNTVLLKAGKIAKIIPTSVSQQVTAMLTSDRNTNYRGEDFEKVLVHMYLGINFLMLKDYDSARVEFKMVNEELLKIKTEEGSARYKQNIMAKYLTAVSYEIIGTMNNDADDIEYAYKEYEQILALNPGLDLVYRDLQRISKQLNYMDDYAKWTKQFGKRDAIPADAGELIVIFQTGKTAIKHSRGGLMSDATMKQSIIVSMSTMSLAAGVTTGAIMVTLNKAENPIPVFKRRTDQINAIRVKINNQYFSTLDMEDIATTAIKNLEDDYGRLRTRVAASIVTKAAASIAAGLAARAIAEKAGGGSMSSLIGVVAGAGTGAMLFSQMKPDLRCWHTLPARLQIGRTFLRPGTYKITLEFIGKNGAITGKKDLTVEIKKGEKTFISERALI